MNMPILTNQRHELFAEHLASGKSATESYSLAGFKPNRANAARLKANEHIGQRVQEIQAVGAKSAEVSVQSLIAELETARAQAQTLGQLSAAVRATAEKAKISGLLIERQQIEVNQADFSLDMPVDEILRQVAAKHGPEGATLLAMMFETEADLPADFLAKHKPAVLKKLQFIHGLAEEAAITVPASTTPQLLLTVCQRTSQA